MKRIGIYGGSFSPIHNGHIEAIKSFQKAMMLDQVLMMPTYIAPHKQTASTAASHHRYEMTRLAFLDYPFVTVSDYEITKQTISYTAETLLHFAPEGELFFLCGSDMFLSMDTWYRPDIIFANATIVLADRDETEIEACLLKKKEYEETFSAKTVILKHKILKLSSTEVRNAVKAGLSIDGMVPPAVAAYIREHQLYV